MGHNFKKGYIDQNTKCNLSFIGLSNPSTNLILFSGGTAAILTGKL